MFTSTWALAHSTWCIICTVAIAGERRGPLIVPGDAVQTAKNIAASERLFRIGTVGDLITFAGDVILVVALYVVLKPINRSVALLAAFWRLAECSILAVITLSDFVALRFLSGADYLRAFDTKQLQALARVFIGVHGDGYRIGIVFFGLGSTVFSYLWFKSRYIPRGLAAWGIFSSLVVTIATLAIMVFPGLAPIVTPASADYDLRNHSRRLAACEGNPGTDRRVTTATEAGASTSPGVNARA